MPAKGRAGGPSDRLASRPPALAVTETASRSRGRVEWLETTRVRATPAPAASPGPLPATFSARDPTRAVATPAPTESVTDGATGASVVRVRAGTVAVGGAAGEAWLDEASPEASLGGVAVAVPESPA